MITLIEAIKFIEERNGKIFAVKFTKRTTGELREMNCRQGVTTGLVENPSKPGTNFAVHNLIGVWDMKMGAYRSIPKEGITAIKIDGVWHNIKN